MPILVQTHAYPASCVLLIRPSVPLFTTLDGDEYFVDGHSSHWAGGVHGSEDYAAAGNQKFDWLHVSAVVISCPPGSQGLELGFGDAVCDGEG